MCKTFNVHIDGTGTQAQILQSLQSLQAEINHTPKPLSRIEARFIVNKLKTAFNDMDNLEIDKITKEYNLVSDYCPYCSVVSPTIRTYKKCVCAYCSHDRLQDITLHHKDDTLTTDITECDTPE